MSGFDFIDCSLRAYAYVWANRQQIARLCGAVLLFKIMSLVAISLLELETQRLRQGLLLLPSYFLEGWVISIIIATAVQSLKGPLFNPDVQKRNAIAGAIVYTLVKLMLAFVMGMTLAGQDFSAPPEETAANGMFIVAVLMVGFMIWSFRFFWVYVPIALGYTVQDFLIKFKKFSASFYMIGLWLMCSVPFVVGILLLLQLLQGLMVTPEGAAPSIAAMIMFSALQAFFDFAVSLVSSLGMAYGIHSVFTGENKKPRLF